MFAVRQLDAQPVRALAERLHLREETARCLLGRGLDANEAEQFLAPRLALLRRPTGLAGFATAVEKISAAVRAGAVIGIFGDYDVDGVTSTALLTAFLREAGGTVAPMVASRHAGYGFTGDAARELISQGARLIVTVDCGTQDETAILEAASLGAEVVVIDHHTVPTHASHPSAALVNPFVPESEFPFRGLASVGLAFYVTAAVRTALRDAGWFAHRDEPDPRSLLDLVALGTVADLVPVVSENRVLTSLGLRELKGRRRPGLAALLRLAGLDAESPIDERTIAFRIAPRLNAPGRLGSALPSLELLLADEVSAEACADVLETANAARRSAQEDVTTAALAAMVDHGSVVVAAGHGWAPGVVGIVAAKLVERTGKPAVVIAIGPDGVGRGSARSLPGIDITQAMRAAGDHTLRAGGHAAAGGVTLHESKLHAFAETVAAAVAGQVSGPAGSFDKTLADARCDLSAIDERLAKEIELLAPFGVGNAAPRFVTRARVQSARRVGDGSHLKLELAANRTTRHGIAFGLGDRMPNEGGEVDVIFRPVMNTFRGMQRIELEVADIAALA